MSSLWFQGSPVQWWRVCTSTKRLTPSSQRNPHFLTNYTDVFHWDLKHSSCLMDQDNSIGSLEPPRQRKAKGRERLGEGRGGEGRGGGKGQVGQREAHYSTRPRTDSSLLKATPEL